MKILTTGLSSFLGTKFINLFDDDCHFLNICRREFKDDAHRVSNIMFDDLEIEKKIQSFNPDIFINLASNSRSKSQSIDDLRSITDFNITMSTYLVDIAISCKVTKIINVSSNWAYLSNQFDPSFFNYYAFTKYALDKYIAHACSKSLTKGVSLVLYDNFDKYDPRNKIFNIIEKAVRNSERTNFSPGKQIINLTRMDDIALALKYITTLKSWEFDTFQYYQISGQEISILQLANFIQEIYNKKNDILNFGGFPYREGEIMQPKYFFDELPYIGNRKKDIFDLIKQELQKP